jgi:hypothetical protein
MIDRITRALEQLVDVEQDRLIVEQQNLAIQQQVLATLKMLVGQPASFLITETAIQSPKEKKMPAMKATVDLVILDDGKGVLFTLQPVNAAGNPVPLPSGTPAISASSSAPGSLAVVPNPGDTTGLQFLGTVPQPPVDATGIVVTFSVTLPNGTALSAAPANPIDVTADNSPVGFSITETAQ